MFFKTGEVFKAYSTEKAANNFKAKFYANDDNVTVEFCGGLYMVVSN